MKSIIMIATVLMLGLLQTVAFANEYAPKDNDRIVLYKVSSENENAPMYSGYFRDSNGVVHDVAVWSGITENYLSGSVTVETSE